MVEINKTITLKLIFLISIIALSSAFFIEYVLGHQPCNLCILERIPYVLALIIIILNYKFKSSSVRDRALYLNEQLQLPENERVLSIKELDEGQVMHKPGKL